MCAGLRRVASGRSQAGRRSQARAASGSRVGLRALARRGGASQASSLASPFPPPPPLYPHGERVAGAGRQALVAGAGRGRADRERRSLPPLAVADRARGRGRGRGRGSRSRGLRAGPQTIASHCIAGVFGHRLDPLTTPHPRSHQNPSNFTVESSSWKCILAVQVTYAVCGPRLPARGCSPRSQAGARVVY